MEIAYQETFEVLSNNLIHHHHYMLNSLLITLDEYENLVNNTIHIARISKKKLASLKFFMKQFPIL